MSRSLIAGVLLACCLCGCLPALAQVPESAARYRQELTRIARQVWGLDAPVPVFAAQIHQESGWRADAVSRVGAQGMAQFMPATSRWWCELTGIRPADCLPQNPAWAMRALVGYDRWLYERLPAAGVEYDRLWATLRSYNGGLGHWQAEARTAASPRREYVDAACGSARRHISHCAENLSYPRRIMITLQPRYQSWGRVVTPEADDD